MSNLKHTPGVQWFISPNSYSCSIVDENGVLVADLAAETDARLIAAAPEMLEALITLKKAFDPNGIGGDMYNNCRGAISKCVQAIEKAAGMKIEEVLK